MTIHPTKWWLKRVGWTFSLTFLPTSPELGGLTGLIQFSELFEVIVHHLSNNSGGLGDSNTSGFHCGDFSFRGSLSALHNRSRVSHSSARRCCYSSNESNHWLRFRPDIVLHQPLRCFLFRASSDFSDHYYSFRFWVSDKSFKHVDEISSVEGISALPFL